MFTPKSFIPENEKFVNEVGSSRSLLEMIADSPQAKQVSRYGELEFPQTAGLLKSTPKGENIKINPLESARKLFSSPENLQIIKEKLKNNQSLTDKEKQLMAQRTYTPILGMLGGIQSTRPIHQVALEKAINKGDIAKAKSIVNAIPADDPYKKSMQNIIKTLSSKEGVKMGTDAAGNKMIHFTDKWGGEGIAKINGDKADILEIWNQERGHDLYKNFVEKLKSQGVKKVSVPEQLPWSKTMLNKLVNEGVLENPSNFTSSQAGSYPQTFTIK